MASEKLTRTQLKEKAQDLLMNQIGNALGYATEMLAATGESVPEGQAEDFALILQREADRIARVFGYEKAWSN